MAGTLAEMSSGSLLPKLHLEDKYKWVCFKGSTRAIIEGSILEHTDHQNQKIAPTLSTYEQTQFRAIQAKV